MTKKIQTNLPCPQCHQKMEPVTLGCSSCDLQVSGTFESHPLLSLTQDELHFLHIFIHCEGKITEMEKALGVSYPTVKAKLNKLKKKISPEESALNILNKMENGEIEYQAGLNKIKKLKNKRK
jgi:hypothetical protein